MVYSNSSVITLSNGIRVAMLPVKDTHLIHCGLMINAGSRDETKETNGVAHLIEHTVFKGTKKRKAYHILNRMESVGGELNAFTSREKTAYYASCLKEYSGRALELLSDITFNSLFPDKEIEKEKRVILDELEMYLDSPEESIADEFMSLLFPGHPLGFDILGTPENLKKLGRDELLNFLSGHYSGENITLAITGNISERRMQYYASKYFDHPLPKKSESNRKPPPDIEAFDIDRPKDFMQQHAMLGFRTPGRHDSTKYALLLLNNMLGGTGMSSRLNMEIREKRGYAYNIWSYYSTFEDCGVFCVYLGTDQQYLNKSIDLVKKELNKLIKSPPGERTLGITKKQVKGQIAMAQENYPVIMQSMAKSLLDYNEILNLKTLFANIDDVTQEDMHEAAKQYLNPEKINILKFTRDKD